MSSHASLRRPKDSRGALRSVGLKIVPGLLILALWQGMYSLNIFSHLVLPSPGEVGHAIFVGLWGGIWWRHVAVTLEETIIAFLLGTVTALLIGAIFAFFKPIRDAFLPYVIAIQNFPKIAIAPLLVTWLGYGLAPKVVIGALLAFFPVLVNTIAGLQEVSDDEIELFRSLRANVIQEFLYLRAPNALTYIFPAFTLAAVGSLLGVIVGEFVGSRAGLGYLILQQTFAGDIAATYGTLFVLAVIGVTIFTLLSLLERRTKFSRRK